MTVKCTPTITADVEESICTEACARLMSCSSDYLMRVASDMDLLHQNRLSRSNDNSSRGVLPPHVKSGCMDDDVSYQISPATSWPIGQLNSSRLFCWLHSRPQITSFIFCPYSYSPRLLFWIYPFTIDGGGGVASRSLRSADIDEGDQRASRGYWEDFSPLQTLQRQNTLPSTDI